MIENQNKYILLQFRQAKSLSYHIVKSYFLDFKYEHAMHSHGLIFNRYKRTYNRRFPLMPVQATQFPFPETTNAIIFCGSIFPGTKKRVLNLIKRHRKSQKVIQGTVFGVML